jgi:predicted RNA binding protein YcfA (HicA-like mRNA interferase family)
MPKLPPMTAREVEIILERAGFVLVRQSGHRIWGKGDRRVPVPMHRGDLKIGTLRGIIEFAGMTTEEFLGYRR